MMAPLTGGRKATVGALVWCAVAVLIGCRPAGLERGSAGAEVVRERESEQVAIKRAILDKERLDLLAQVDTLAASLARREAERDRERYERERETGPDGLSVRSYDGRWGWVVLDGGAGGGVSQEQTYGIYRGETWVARVRVADVRERVSGAWVEELRAGWTPAPGDRAVREQRER